MITALSCRHESSEPLFAPCDDDGPNFDTLVVSGADTADLGRAVARAGEASGVYAMIVLKDGYPVLEKYFGGKTADDTFAVRSVTKSVVSALVGMAIDRGLVGDVDDPIKKYFPDYIRDTSDARKQQITVRHLLTMTAGFQWTEGSDRLYGNYVESAVSTPMSSTPGAVFNYNSALPHILSGLITRTAGASTTTFAEKYLFEPLGVNVYRWDVDAQGIAIGGTGLRLSARDMAKIGEMYLNHGCFDRKQVVSGDWIASSLTNHVPSPGYGYLWWKGGESTTYYYAWGYGGQMIFVHDAMHLSAVFTADPNVNNATADATKNLLIDIFENDIIKAFNP